MDRHLNFVGDNESTWIIWLMLIARDLCNIFTNVLHLSELLVTSRQED